MVKRFGLFLGPLLFILFSNLSGAGLNPEAWKVLSIAAWMITWWISEAVPIPVTALLPLFIFPIIGVLPIMESAAPYASPIIFLFMGGFMIGLAMKKRRLHERIALHLIQLTGTHANGIILGFMIATAFLSMWISNTAATVMMLPVAISVIALIRNNKNPVQFNEKDHHRFALTLLLGIAYSANIGGTATIVGTPPNAVLVGYLKQMYDYDLTFSRWLLLGIPVSATLLFITYLLLTRVLFPNRLGNMGNSAELIGNKLKALGKPSRAERMVMLLFLLTAFAWILRQPINYYLDTNLNDTMIAMIGGLSMFVFPVSIRKMEFIMDWEDTKDLPWGILILFGGGLCLAKGMEISGIIQVIGDNIASYGNIQIWIVVILLTGTVLFMTELMSNVALVTIFIPVVMGIADGLGMSPLYLAIPVTLASSCAFMMPISTPPNAIVFSSGKIKMRQMMKAGVWLNLISIIILWLAYETLVKLLY
jgi:solute carrier family 13 (sodium-dependent dicarboxylate transporter), member 2/3/5